MTSFADVLQSQTIVYLGQYSKVVGTAHEFVEPSPFEHSSDDDPNEIKVAPAPKEVENEEKRSERTLVLSSDEKHPSPGRPSLSPTQSGFGSASCSSSASSSRASLAPAAVTIQ